MNVLFVHDCFPGHYQHLAAALAADPANRVVFLARRRAGEVPGVEPLAFLPARGPHETTHPYLRSTEAAVLNGQAVFRACRRLEGRGFWPDVICAHSGFGASLFLKQAFPGVPLLGHFEWFYHGRNGDGDYLDPAVATEDFVCAAWTRNAQLLLDLAQCDRAVCPTDFQRSRFPAAFRDRLAVLHEGVDTEFYRPAPGTPMALPGLDLSQAGEIVTYATRGMEPYRGFPQFMRAAAILQARRPQAHIVIAGSDSVHYGARPADGASFRERMLAELPELDRDRLHFVGHLPAEDYRRLLQASSVHVYLSVPFVLSWSLLEAMACGGLIVASAGPPVSEAIEPDRHGLLVDFFSHTALAEAIGRALDHPTRMKSLREAARRRVEEHFALSRLLPRQIALLREMSGPETERVKKTSIKMSNCLINHEATL
jgi:glycosyltransferase involved in cell wall biosynthesis